MSRLWVFGYQCSFTHLQHRYKSVSSQKHTLGFIPNGPKLSCVLESDGAWRVKPMTDQRSIPSCSIHNSDWEKKQITEKWMNEFYIRYMFYSILYIGYKYLGLS